MGGHHPHCGARNYQCGSYDNDKSRPHRLLGATRMVYFFTKTVALYQGKFLDAEMGACGMLIDTSSMDGKVRPLKACICSDY